MDSSASRLAWLLNRYHDKTITEEESKELSRLINQASDDELTVFLREEWENPSTGDPVFSSSTSAEMLDNILGPADAGGKTGGPGRMHEPPAGKQRKSLAFPLTFQKMAAAVAILLMVTATLYLIFRPGPGSRQPVASHQLTHDALPGGNIATLTLSNGQTIALDTAQNGVLAVQGSITVDKARDGQLVYKVTGSAANKPVAFNTLSTPRGGQYQIVLPDGTKVWLNAASSLKFPALFEGGQRLVELTGEAYFEVAKNPEMPFKVRSAATEVVVLGTHFNIMAYDDEQVLKTTLLEGAVKIKNAGRENILKPGQQAVVDKAGSMKILDNVDVAAAVAWKNGLFQFKDTDLKTIMRQAARWYDLEIRYEGEIPERHYTGRISRNVRASELLSILEYTGVNFRIQGETIIVTN